MEVGDVGLVAMAADQATLGRGENNNEKYFRNESILVFHEIVPEREKGWGGAQSSIEEVDSRNLDLGA